MRTQATTIIMLALGVAFAMTQAGGLAGAWGMSEQPISGDRAQGALQNASNDSAASSGGELSGDAATNDGESDIISMILNGGQMLSDTVVAIVGLPVTLSKLGFPTWFAMPIGSLAVVVAGVGLVQFVTGRVYR